MLNLIKWDKPLKVNGKVYSNSDEAYKALKNFDGDIKVEFNFKADDKPVNVSQPVSNKPAETKPTIDNNVYVIKVRQYMTKHWDFNDKQNGGVPMPLRVMVGKVLQETKGMVKMELWGKPMPSSICCKCGRHLTHPVSLIYGIGPECGQHFHISPYETEDELKADYEALRQRMADIKWTGWVIKSAIEEKRLLDLEEVV